MALPEVCPTMDNATIRILLSPHPLIPDDAPIDPADDQTLLTQARTVLAQYSFVDVIENPSWSDALSGWLGVKLELQRLNETRPGGHGLGNELSAHLTPSVLQRLRDYTRLDQQLWFDVVGPAPFGVTPEAFADACWAGTVARHARTMAG
jgi:hypothetical protein